MKLMNNTDYSKMSDKEINKRVAFALGCKELMPGIFMDDNRRYEFDKPKNKSGNRFYFDPCNNPADAWSIIYQNGISIGVYGHGEWGAATINHCHIDGTNPLRAAMIVFLKMQESKNISEEMLNNLEKTLKTENFDTYE